MSRKPGVRAGQPDLKPVSLLTELSDFVLVLDGGGQDSGGGERGAPHRLLRHQKMNGN
jgi:hypothetical protein